MLSPFHWPGWGWRLLSERLSRLRQTLETIQENLHQAIARAIGQSFGELLHDIVHTLLAEDECMPTPSTYRPQPRPPAYGRDQPPAHSDPWYERFDAEQAEEERRGWPKSPGMIRTNPHRPNLSSGPAGCSAAGRLPGDHLVAAATPGPYPLLAALAVGSVTGTVAYGVHPATGVGVGLAGSLLSLLTLRNRLLFGTSFLNRHETARR